jgi:hypothetical protein
VREVAGCEAIDFGRTYNAGFFHRILSVLKQVVDTRKHQSLFEQADIVLARNLEMLAIGVRGRSLCAQKPVLIYECLDIHRLLLNRGPVGLALRWLEGWLSQHAAALLTSSPAFIDCYFKSLSRVRLPIRLVENKVLMSGNENLSSAPRTAKLADLAVRSRGAVEIVIRGKPAPDQFPDFEQQIATMPGVRFLGPYKNPEDLATIYSEVHFSWAIDMFEEGLNSSWLLPNRLYESGLFGAVPVALAGVETGHFLKHLGIGVTIDEPLDETLLSFFRNLKLEHYSILQNAMLEVPRSQWAYDRVDCEGLVGYLKSVCEKADA